MDVIIPESAGLSRLARTSIYIRDRCCGWWKMRWGKIRCQAKPKTSFGNSWMRCLPSWSISPSLRSA